ncbi:hypothetical protein [Streptomyces sp. Midd1]|uniref:hypothetical protein n=1 Tax=Streptomyces sp. Midd3 TaxID=3161191 RepID=UPI0034DB0B52
MLTSLPAHYNCYMNCAEVEAAADLMRAFGFNEEYIEELIKDHAEDDECGDRHHECTDACFV